MTSTDGTCVARPLRRPVAVLVALAIVLAGLVASAPAHADEDGVDGATRWLLQSRPTTIERGGRPYELRVQVESFRGFDHGAPGVMITLRSLSDPIGPVRATQTHRLSYLIKGSFRHRADLSRASLNDGRALGAHQGLRLSFAATRPAEDQCDGHIRRRVGRLSGSLRLRTGTGQIGLLTELPRTAVLYHHDGDCEQDYRLPCPGNTLRLDGSEISYRNGVPTSTFTRFARHADAPTAEVRVERSVSGHRLARSSEIVATLPAWRVAIADDMSEATVTAARGSYLRGTLNVSFSGPEQPDSNNPHYCDRAGAYAETLRFDGDQSGHLAAMFWIGPELDLPTRDMHVNAYRTVMAQ